MKKTLTTCLLVVALCPFAFSQDKTAKERDAAKDLADRKAAMQRSIDAAMPVVEDADLGINIASKKNQFYGGEPIRVNITLMNTGNGPLAFMQAPAEMVYDIQVIDSLGLPVENLPSRSMRHYGGSMRIATLRHGESLSGWVNVSNLFDMSLNGTYKVKVSKRFRIQKTKEPVTITSNTLTVQVTSDSPTSGWYSSSEVSQ